MDTEPASIPSGGAAQDINTGNVTINGQQLTPGTYPVTVLDVSNWGWGQTCAFSSTDADTVSWGIGVFTSASGVSYNIAAGNTGNMAAKTYIYLDLLVSETAYQVTTTPANAVGIGKVLIAVAENATAPNLATYNLSEATQIVGDNILANSINASKIVAGSITTTQLNFTPVTSTNVVASINASAEGIQISGARIAISGSTTFSAGYDPTTKLPTASAGNLAYLNTVGNAQIDNGAVEDAKLGTTVIVGGYIKTSLLTADNIQAGTLTGRTVRTASSGTRVELNGSSNKILIYNGSTLRAQGYESGWTYYNSSGDAIGNIFADGSDFLIKGASSSSDIFLSRGSSGTVTMGTGSTPELTWDGDDFYPLSDGSKGLGTSGYHWDVLYADYITGDNWISMGTYVRSGTYMDVGTYLDVNGGHITIAGNYFMRLKSMTGATAAGVSGAQNGAMYYRSDVGDIRVYVGGTWRSINVT